MQRAIPEADIGLRKLVVYREVVVTEAGAQPARPAQQASVAAVVHNPWVGTGPTQDLSDEVARIAPTLAKLLTDRLIAALGAWTPSRPSARPPSSAAPARSSTAGAHPHAVLRQPDA